MRKSKDRQTQGILTPFRLNLFFLILLATATAAWANCNVSKDLLRLERILDVLESSPDFIWRQRANLTTVFEGARVFTDQNGFRTNADASKHPNGKPFTIVTLGASPTFGYGVEFEQAYPAIAEEILRRRSPEIRVVNAGQIGFSSWQGLKLFSVLADEWRPDLVTVSYVVNDIDRLRFFQSNGRTDYQTEPPTATSSALSNFIAQTWPLSFAAKQERRILVKLASRLSQRKSYELAQVRSLPEDYERNLHEFAAKARDLGIPLLFIKMPFRLPEEIPEETAKLEMKLDDIESLISSGSYSEANKKSEKLFEIEKHASRLYYLRGLLAENAGSDELAREQYRLAMRHVIYDCARDARRYNSIMEKVARELDLPLADPAQRLGGVSADMEYFVSGDYIHPNPSGHRIIGNCVSDAIGRILSGESGFFIQKCE